MNNDRNGSTEENRKWKTFALDSDLKKSSLICTYAVYNTGSTISYNLCIFFCPVKVTVRGYSFPRFLRDRGSQPNLFFKKRADKGVA